MEQFFEIAKDIPAILEALLAIIGGLKLLARYTKWKWDDKAFDIADSAMRKIMFFLPPKKKE